MTNLFSLYATLLLLSTSSALMVMVASDKCKEDLGACSSDCNTKCLIAHQGKGQGICQPRSEGNGQMGCWCYFDCAEKRLCQDGVPYAGKQCNDKYCDSQCAAKHPGQGTQGFCYSEDPLYHSCECTYFC